MRWCDSGHSTRVRFRSSENIPLALAWRDQLFPACANPSEWSIRISVIRPYWHTAFVLPTTRKNTIEWKPRRAIILIIALDKRMKMAETRESLYSWREGSCLAIIQGNPWSSRKNGKTCNLRWHKNSCPWSSLRSSLSFKDNPSGLLQFAIGWDLLPRFIRVFL